AAPAGQGSGQIWAGNADNVPAGTQASIAVPANTLTDGWQVRWRARAVSPTTTSAWSPWQLLTVDLPKPAVTGLAVAPSKVVEGVTVTTTLTPALKATLTHPTGQALRAEVEVEHDPAAPQGQGTGQIWIGSLDDVASGTQAGITVPAGELTDGWQVRWRARAVAGQAFSAWSGWQQVTVLLPEAGTGPFAQTAGPVIQSDRSFTIGAWVRLSDKDGDYTVAEQKGVNQAPFRLGNDLEDGLVFTFTSADATGATTEGVLSGVEPPVNEWFHLVGVYTAGSRNAALYLNGLEIGSATLGFDSWNAIGPLTLGTLISGSLDEVWVYGHDLISAEVFALADGSATAGVESVQAATERSAKTSAAPASRYDRITPKDCWRDHGHRTRTYGLMKNRFSGCMIHKVTVTEGSGVVTDDDVDAVQFYGDEEWRGRIMFVAKTWNGKPQLESGATPRDIWFDLYVGHSERTDVDPSDTDLTIGMLPASDQTACRNVTTFAGGAQQNHLTMDVEDWVDAADQTANGEWSKLATFRFRADPDHAPATRKERDGSTVQNSGAEYDRISNCVFRPYAKIQRTDSHWVLLEYGTIKEQAQITCDSARGVAAKAGGCTLPVVPSIEWKLNGTYDTAYKHYWKACYQKTDTYPKDSAKQIPGCAVNGTGRPSKEHYLWRVSDPVAKNSNARARTRCNGLWPGFVIAMQECDEYPFQSAGNRSDDSDKKRNFSVCAMPGGPSGPNQKAGKALARLYNKDRVLYGQDFFNRFSTQLTNVETMQQLCYQPLNALNTFAIDKSQD
ncbi:LamG domain-containing protein, partial [Streptosporangium saharense]|uniref:LamG domain-containing protein n=1 Tax=Streptosporangium saharense TaxID=1706840 RepID=UPI00367CF815